MITRRIKLPFNVKKPIIACGADLKGAFALAKGDGAFLVYDFGDLGDLDNFTRYSAAINKYRKKLGIKPQIIACDLHPNYFSTHFAEDLLLKDGDLKLCPVQHHEAHIASAIIDGKIKGDVIGVAFDGTGYGTDGKIWGGEFFAGGLKSFKRAAHLEYVPMPGADMAIKEPWRMAVSYLRNAFGNKLPPLAKRWGSKKMAMLRTMADKNINSPLTSSAGRLFDGVASLVLSKDHAKREAELPIEFEKIAAANSRERYGFEIKRDGGELVTGTAILIREIVKDLSDKIGKPVISGKFHNTMAEIIIEASLRLSKSFRIKQVVLSGGVFQNKYLTAQTLKGLRAKGLKVYSHVDVPTNDSGIPIGQIAIANTRSICA